MLNPATEETIARVPRCGAEDVDAAVAGGARGAYRVGSRRPRPSAPRRSSDSPRCSRQNAEELAAIESANVGKPLAYARDEIPVCVDNLRFFAGAARLLEGKSAGEYMRGYTSMIRREPLGVVGGIVALELPADDGGLEARPGARRRQHPGPEAVRADAALAAALRRARRRRPARRAC